MRRGDVVCARAARDCRSAWAIAAKAIAKGQAPPTAQEADLKEQQQAMVDECNEELAVAAAQVEERQSMLAEDRSIFQ